jgi:hypothetical protein
MNFREPSPEEKNQWEGWVASRPVIVRSVIETYKFEPWKLYRLKSSNHRVTLISFEEHNGAPVTLKVAVTGDFNCVAFERAVFGIKPEDLEECDLPAPDEILGSAGMSLEEVITLRDAAKAGISPLPTSWAVEEAMILLHDTAKAESN